MSIFQASVIAEYPVIGWDRYEFNGNQGFRINCIESHPEGEEHRKGSFETIINGAYSESKKFEGLKISADNPHMATMRGHFVKRQNKSVFECDEIIDIKPIKSSTTTTEQGKTSTTTAPSTTAKK